MQNYWFVMLILRVISLLTQFYLIFTGLLPNRFYYGFLKNEFNHQQLIVQPHSVLGNVKSLFSAVLPQHTLRNLDSLIKN